MRIGQTNLDIHRVGILTWVLDNAFIICQIDVTRNFVVKELPAVKQESPRAEATNYDNRHKKESGSRILWLRTCPAKPLLHW